ncbi:MAG TPA: zf-HC2 domain-containing protein [Chthonomonadaceae bacterium]|nr:zf-HC2 domain-containing protein [Chthonomonadaceae bacterium]
MLTRNPSAHAGGVQDGGDPFTQQAPPSDLPIDYAVVPPAKQGGRFGEGGEPESCRLVVVNLSAYLDSELDPDQAQLVADHLNSCPRCADLLDAMEGTDEDIVREWRDSAPLPSSSQFRNGVDAIMGALPPAAAAAEPFAPRRVHSRTRWMRFATGLSGVIVAGGMLWSSYRLGYVQGRAVAKRTSFPIPQPESSYQPGPRRFALNSLTSPPSIPPEPTESLSLSRAERSRR